VILPAKNHITIDGFILTNCPPEGHSGVVTISGATDVEILHCRIGHRRPEGYYGLGITASSCSNLRIEGNVVWGTRYQLTMEGCSNSLVRGNTFVGGDVYSCMLRGTHAGIRMVNNIWYCPSGRYNPNIAVYLPQGQTKPEFQSDYNLFLLEARNRKVAMVYAGSIQEVAVPGNVLGEWQEKSGRDRHSVQADPMFVDLEKGDFRLRPVSPAIGSAQGGGNIGACEAVNRW